MIASVLPEAWWLSSPTWLLVVVTAVSLVVLAVGADKAVAAAVRLASVLGMSKVIIGATIVSLGTTMPELFVSVTAALSGKGELALGNAVGSITADTAFIFGLALVLTRLPHDRFLLYRQGIFKLSTTTMLAVTLVVLAVLHGGVQGVVVPRAVGMAYVGLLVLYMYLSVRWAKAHPEYLPPEAMEEAGHAGMARGKGAAWSVLALAAGLVAVAFSSDALIGSVSVLASRGGVPPDILAVTIVAVGTSLPELVTSLTAIRRGHGELAVGNVIGADILNVLFVAGVSATATPLTVDANFFYYHLPAMWISTAMMGTFIFTSKGTFKRWQGVPLLALYAAYLVVLVAVIGVKK